MDGRPKHNTLTPHPPTFPRLHLVKVLVDVRVRGSHGLHLPHRLPFAAPGDALPLQGSASPPWEGGRGGGSGCRAQRERRAERKSNHCVRITLPSAILGEFWGNLPLHAPAPQSSARCYPTLLHRYPNT